MTYVLEAVGLILAICTGFWKVGSHPFCNTCGSLLKRTRGRNNWKCLECNKSISVKGL